MKSNIVPRHFARPSALRLAALCLAAGLPHYALARESTDEAPPPEAPQSPEVPQSPEAPAPETHLTRAPVLKRFVAAEVLADAPPLEHDATVLLELTVQVDGSVRDVRVVQGVDSWRNDAAQQAVQGFAFSPAEVDDKPAPVRIRYEYVFLGPPREEVNSEVALSSETPSPAPAPAEAPTPAPPGRLSGQLLESGTRRPVVGAQVVLPALGHQTLTDEEGRFSFFPLPPGAVELELLAPEHAPIHDREVVEPDADTRVVYYTQETALDEDELVAVGKKERLIVVRRELSRQELDTAPGSNGDALRAVQNLPGVARTTGDQLVFRGSRAGRVLVNGYPITTAFHFGGIRSTVGNGLIESLSLSPGNYGARYGDSNAGIIDIQTRRPAADGAHGFAQIDLYDASLLVEGPVSENATLAFGGRRSYIDAVLNWALSDDEKKVFRTAPRYYDFQGSYDWQSGKHRVRFNAFGSQDQMVLYLDEPLENDPAVRGKLSNLTRWISGQALWDYRVNDKTQVSAGLSYLLDDLEGSLAASVYGRFRDHVTTFRGDVTHELAPWLSARTGLQVNAHRATLSARAPQANVEGEVPSNFSAMETVVVKGARRLLNPAAYLAADVRLGPLLLVPALRAEHVSRPDQFGGTALLMPRLSARYSASETTTLRAAAGSYSRNPESFELIDGFGNPRLEPELARHYSAGVEQQLSTAANLSVTGFYADLYHQVSVVDAPDVRLDNGGRGRAYGSEFLLKHDLRGRFYGWVAYTLMRSERRASGDDRYRLFRYDQTHNLSAIGHYRLTPTWDLGARFRYVSGRPTTPVVGAVYDSDADVYTPLRGPEGSARLGPFHQLDVRVDKHWLFDTWKLSAYLDVQNIYNHENPEAVSYNFNYSRSGVTAGLPLIPSFGLKGEF